MIATCARSGARCVRHVTSSLLMAAPALAQTPAPAARRAPAGSGQIRSRFGRNSTGCARSSRRFATPTARGLRRSRRGWAERRLPGIAPAPATRLQPAPAVCAGRPRQPPAGAGADVPSGAAGAGGPQGALAGLRRRQRELEGLQSRHGGDWQLPRRGRREHDRVRPALEMHEAEVTFQAVVDPYARADFFLAASPEASRSRKASSRSRGCPAGCWRRSAR